MFVGKVIPPVAILFDKLADNSTKEPLMSADENTGFASRVVTRVLKEELGCVKAPLICVDICAELDKVFVGKVIPPAAILDANEADKAVNEPLIFEAS